MYNTKGTQELRIIQPNPSKYIAVSPNGKATDSDSVISRFESLYRCYKKRQSFFTRTVLFHLTSDYFLENFLRKEPFHKWFFFQKHFPDAGSISGWAKNATRAETAQMIMAFQRKFGK